jgi:hypothetical protein
MGTQGFGDPTRSCVVRSAHQGNLLGEPWMSDGKVVGLLLARRGSTFPAFGSLFTGRGFLAFLLLLKAFLAGWSLESGRHRSGGTANCAGRWRADSGRTWQTGGRRASGAASFAANARPFTATESA